MPRVKGVAAVADAGGITVAEDARAGRDGRAAVAVAAREDLRKVRLELGIGIRSELGSGACKVTWTA